MTEKNDRNMAVSYTTAWCDFPHLSPTAAEYDARTFSGQWAYLCRHHWRTKTDQTLGTGKGQKLVDHRLLEPDEIKKINETGNL